MKIKLTDKIRIALQRAMGKESLLRIEYQRKSDGARGTYLINGNFIENGKDRFNTYAYATGFHNGSIKTFIKSNVKSVKLLSNKKNLFASI